MRIRWVFGVAVFVFLAGNVSAITPKVVHNLTVSRHFNIVFSNGDADGNFNGATTVLLQDDQGCTDEVACCVEMSRLGNVTTFGVSTDGLDILTTQTEVNQVFAMGGNFKVVTSITLSGQPILGIAKFNERNTIMTLTADPDVWAHEFGHNQGLLHRDNCNANIMHSVAPNTTSVNCSECIAFRIAGTNNGTCSFTQCDQRHISSSANILVTNNVMVGGDIHLDGTIQSKSFKSSIENAKNGSQEASATLSPKATITFRGTNRLDSGEVRVNLPTSVTIRMDANDSWSYTVRLTPTDDCNGLYVAEKGPDYFVVRELRDGDSDASFNWEVSAPRMLPNYSAPLKKK